MNEGGDLVNMSFIFSLIKRVNSEGRSSTENPTSLSKIKDETKFVLPSEKVVDLVQDRLTKKGSFPLFTDVETFLLVDQSNK